MSSNYPHEKLDLESPPSPQVARQPIFRSDPWKNTFFRAILAVGLLLCGLHLWDLGDGFSNWTWPHHKRPHRLFGKEAEKLFLSIPNNKSALAASRQFTEVPHMAGSIGDLSTAKAFLELLQRELGIHPPPASEYPLYAAGSSESQSAIRGIPHRMHPHAWIDTYYPVMNTPLERSVQIVDDDGSVLWDADLKEYSNEVDPEAHKYSDAVPTFHGLSKAGDVTAHIVDGNYCTKEDYDKLVKKDAPLNGSIVLCRYGGIFRGLKVKGGQETGAVGVLIYSDPRDDGTVTIENGYLPYPNGPARSPTSVQRGSVQFISAYPGDPTTPGYPSYENSTRSEGTNIPSIPSIPISWENAEKLLGTLKDGNAMEGKKVRLMNNVDTKIIPIWNTMGVIPGYIKDEVVIIGNHRDAWVLGAADPISGTTCVNEVIRGLGELMKKGWKPLRTIVIASWDAEEYGLIGSTEWGEDFEDWINDHVVAYFNLDNTISGSRLAAAGSPLLSHFIRDTAIEIPHPTDKGRTLWDARNDDGIFLGEKNITINEEALAMREMESSAADDVGVRVLGSGSDYTVFLQRIGVASSDSSRFNPTLHDPVYHYHSIFDSQRWQEVYADPDFSRHVAAAKHFGLQAVRLSDSIVLPFNTTHYAYELESYLDQVERIAASESIDVQFSSLRKSIHSLQKASKNLDEEKKEAVHNLKKILHDWKKKHHRIRRKIRKIICRIKKKFGHPCRHRHHHRKIAEGECASAVPHHATAKPRFGRIPGEIKEQELQVAYAIALEAGIELPQDVVEMWDSVGAIPWPEEHKPHHHPKFPFEKLRRAVRRIQAVNKKLASFERGFISKEGIKDREWFRHLAVAPGKWLGYGATTLPALTEALTFDKNATMAQHEAERLRVLINKLAEHIKVEK